MHDRNFKSGVSAHVMYEKNMERLKSVQSELQTQVALSDGFVSDFVFTRFIRV